MKEKKPTKKQIENDADKLCNATVQIAQFTEILCRAQDIKPSDSVDIMILAMTRILFVQARVVDNMPAAFKIIAERLEYHRMTSNGGKLDLSPLSKN